MVAYLIRFTSYWVCRSLGAVFAQVRRPLLRHVVIIAGIAGALAGAGALAPVASTRAPAAEAALRAAGDWFSPWNVLSVWAFGFLVWSIVRARRQLVIERFDDFTDKSAGVNPSGFGLLVAAQLSALNDMFREVEVGHDIQATGDTFTPINADLQADGAGTSLDTAISSESSFGLGPIRLPVGVVTALLGRLVQGPTLRGQIHRDGETRVLTIRLAGRLGNRSWRITDRALEAEAGKERWRSAVDLADDVAYRVFTEIAMGSSVRWEAFARFTEGVQAYHRSLRVSNERHSSLRTAERKLIAAQGADARFDLAFYNLGVVYTALGELAGAASAYEQARSLNVTSWRSYHALAVTNLQRAILSFQSDKRAAALLQISRCLDHAREAIRLAPDAPSRTQDYNVVSAAFWWRGLNSGPIPVHLDLDQAGRHARRAARTSWRALCRAELGVGPEAAERHVMRSRARAVAVQSLRNYAELLLTSVDLDDRAWKAGVTPPAIDKLTRPILITNAIGCLRLARMLAPREAQIHVELGKALRLRERWADVARSLGTAERLDPAKTTFALGTLALAQARLDTFSQFKETAARIFERAHAASPESIAALVEAAEVRRRLVEEIARMAEGTRGGPRLLAKARLMARFFRLSWRLAERRLAGMRQATALLPVLVTNEESRNLVMAEIDELCDRAKALESLKKELAQLKAQDPGALERLSELMRDQQAAGRFWELAEVSHALARAYMNADRLDDARQVFTEVIKNLEGALDSEIQRRGMYAELARVYRIQGNLQEALDQARTAVNRDPLGAFERIELGHVYFELRQFAAAQRAWEEALQLTPNVPALHVNLGRTHIRQLASCETPAERGRRLQAARRELEAALDLFDRPQDGNAARYFLAAVHAQLGRYADTLRELQALERSGYCPLVVRLDIADAHLARDQWFEAEPLFRAIAADVDAEIAAHGADHRVESPDNDYTLGVASAFAHLGIAASYAGRDIYLDRALAEVALARGALSKVTSLSVTNWEASCALTEGSILLKGDDADAAVDRLQSSLAVSQRSETYLHLAEALIRQAEKRPAGTDHFPVVRRAGSYLAEAEKLDWTGQLTKQIPMVSARVSKLSQRSIPPS